MLENALRLRQISVTDSSSSSSSGGGGGFSSPSPSVSNGRRQPILRRAAATVALAAAAAAAAAAGARVAKASPGAGHLAGTHDETRSSGSSCGANASAAGGHPPQIQDNFPSTNAPTHNVQPHNPLSPLFDSASGAAVTCAATAAAAAALAMALRGREL